MSALTSTGTELRRFRRGALPKIAIAALILIPLLYGALYLWAFWDPTGNMDRLPVALVNADQPVTLSDGTVLNAGEEVADTLLSSADLEWVSTDAATAQQGVKDGLYYFALSIPDNFSADIASAEGDAPTRAQLDVTYSDSNSFLASTLGHSAMVQVDAAVRTTIGDEAVNTVLVGLGSARDGFASAADGAVTLQAAGGDLTDGAHQVADGVDATHDGAVQLASGASDAQAGAKQLADGAHTAMTGATSLSAGASSLASNLHLAENGSGSLATGADRLSAGVSSAVDQIGTMSTSLQSASPALKDALTYLAGRAQAGDASAAAPLTELSAVATSLGSFDLKGTAAQLAELEAGAGDVASGASALDSAVGKLSAGADQLADGAVRLTDGTSALADGASQLSNGTVRLADGTSELAAATGLLADGAHSVADGAEQLTDGAGTLADGLATGAEAIPDDSAALRDARGDVISTPVALDESHLTEAEGFGEGFAPFFIPLALFVGSLITWLLFRPLPSRALATPANGFRATFAGFLPAGLIATGQVIVMLAVIHLGVGLEMSSTVGTFAFTLLVAMAFVTVQQMLIAVLGPAAGKVAILALLMLQLASSGGTYPVETTPAFFRGIHDFLPMTYAVTGLREVITGGVDGRFWSSVAVLLAIVIGSLAITAWRAGRMRTWTLERLHPVLTI